MSVAAEARRGGWIQTASGRSFYPMDPRPEDVDIGDIAHALANQCRFAGHTREFLSVAEHCVRVSRECPPEHALWGLLHDASEAYLVDLPRPIKGDPGMIAYREAEGRVMGAVCVRFGLAMEMPASVHRADNVLLATEARDLMGDPDWRRSGGYDPLPVRIEPWTPERARSEFLARFAELNGGG